MAIAYRTQTITAIYNAIAGDTWFAARYPSRRLIPDSREGVFKKLIFRAPNEFPQIEVRTGRNHRGEMFGIQNYGQERSGLVSDGNQTLVTAQLVVEVLFDANPQSFPPDHERDEFEIRIEAIIRDKGRKGIHPALVGMSFTAEQSAQTLPNEKKAWRLAITLDCTYSLKPADVLPGSPL